MGVGMTPLLSHSSGQLCDLCQHLPRQCPRGLGSGAICQDSCQHHRVVLSPVLLLPERTLMLPLTEGSLRLRADDEDSLTSEDSFFSATEVIGLAQPLGQY